MFLLETKNLTKIVKGYNKKSELHVSPAGVRVGAPASLCVSCVGTSRHQKGTKAPSKCFKCYTLLRPIICITLKLHIICVFSPWTLYDTRGCVGDRATRAGGCGTLFVPLFVICILPTIPIGILYYSFGTFSNLAAPSATLQHLLATTLVTWSASSFLPFLNVARI